MVVSTLQQFHESTLTLILQNYTLLMSSVLLGILYNITHILRNSTTMLFCVIRKLYAVLTVTVILGFNKQPK